MILINYAYLITIITFNIKLNMKITRTLPSILEQDSENIYNKPNIRSSLPATYPQPHIQYLAQDEINRPYSYQNKSRKRKSIFGMKNKTSNKDMIKDNVIETNLKFSEDEINKKYKIKQQLVKKVASPIRRNQKEQQNYSQQKLFLKISELQKHLFEVKKDLENQSMEYSTRSQHQKDITYEDNKYSEIRRMRLELERQNRCQKIAKQTQYLYNQLENTLKKQTQQIIAYKNNQIDNISQSPYSEYNPHDRMSSSKKINHFKYSGFQDITQFTKQVQLQSMKNINQFGQILSPLSFPSHFTQQNFMNSKASNNNHIISYPPPNINSNLISHRAANIIRKIPDEVIGDRRVINNSNKSCEHRNGYVVDFNYKNLGNPVQVRKSVYIK